MKTFHTAVLATLMTSTLAIGAIAPASAQDAPPPRAPMAQQHHAGPGFGPGPRPMHRGHGDLLNFQRGAEGVEIALVRLAHRLDLTEEQKPLLENLQAAALSAATDFEAAVKDLRPTPPAFPAQPAGADVTAPKPPPAPPAPDFSKNLDARIALGKANVAALEAIKPSYDAFFGSLSDEQKAKFAPSPRERGERGSRGGPQGQQGPKGRAPRH